MTLDGETGEGACLRRVKWGSWTQYDHAGSMVPTKAGKKGEAPSLV